MLTLVVGADHHAFKHLDALFVAFFDFLVDADRVAAPHINDGRLLLLVIDFLDQCKTHDFLSI